MIKFLSEIAPWIALFIGFNRGGGMLGATKYMLVVSTISIILCYIVERKFYKFSLISFVVMLIAGTTTLVTGNAMFIKIKPTILYIVFGAAFYISALKKRPIIKYALAETVNLKEECWYILSYRFAAFFLVMAVVNELVWRNFDEATWVHFKLFGALPVTFVFILLQLPLLMRSRLPDQDS